MRSFVIIGICFVLAFWVYKKFESDNFYYDSLVNDKSEFSVLERGLLSLQREYDLSIRKEEVVLRKYEKGEISQEEYDLYLKLKSKKERAETDQALQDISRVLDPKKGVFSGIIKMTSSPKFQKNKQIGELNKKIEMIVADFGIASNAEIVLRLSTLSWIPIGNVEIDLQMAEYFKNKINNLKLELNDL